MSGKTIFATIVLIAGIILFIANIGSAMDFVNDVADSLSKNTSSSTTQPSSSTTQPSSSTTPSSSSTTPSSSSTASSYDSQLAKKISAAIQPNNSTVRSLALSLISSNHSGERNIMQVCDIYTGLVKRWTYVSDPNGSEYFAPAGESARLLRGDCDDFAILMASCIASVGGHARVIVAQSTSKGGHAYAEVYLTSNANDNTKLLQSISNAYHDTVYTHQDYSSGEYWLNLDWSANHPGGKFFPNTGSILIIYPNGYYERQNFTPNNTY